MIYGIIEDESSQGLAPLELNFYPHSQQTLEKELNKIPPINQRKYAERHWRLFVERELQKLWQYDYDITYEYSAFRKDESQLRKYQRSVTAFYVCQCGNIWQNVNQRLTFQFTFVAEHGYLNSSLSKQNKVSCQSAAFGKELANQLSSLLEKTIYPYLLRYQLVIEKSQCKQCSKTVIPRLQKSKIRTLSKLFCRKVCEILSKQKSPTRSSREEAPSQRN